MRKAAHILIDGQWGSTGKGAVAGALYNRFPEVFVSGVSDNMPNAGHTVYHGTERHILKVLPVSCIRTGRGIIGPHAVFNVQRLLSEISLSPVKITNLCIDPMASVLAVQDVEREQELVGIIASTGQGSMEATIRKMKRDGTATLAGDYFTEKPELLISHPGVRVGSANVASGEILNGQGGLLIEGSQGFDLGLNHGMSYPHVTSRDVLPGRMADNAGVALRDVGRIVGVVRTFPIRVGNVGETSSGPHYFDQEELLWEDISGYCGKEVMERTTVTNRVRRVFTFSGLQLRKFIRQVKPDGIVVTFMDYAVNSSIIDFIYGVCGPAGVKVIATSKGPTDDDFTWNVDGSWWGGDA